jgi:hypothetical protein
MTKATKVLSTAALAATAGLLGSTSTFGAVFTAPSITTPILSVDVNGGLAALSNAAATSPGNQTGDQKPGQGWNGSNTAPGYSPDQFGVSWSPWGGQTSPTSANGQAAGDGLYWGDANNSFPADTTNGSFTIIGSTANPAGGDGKTSYAKNFTTGIGTLKATIAADGTTSAYTVYSTGNTDGFGGKAGGYIINSRDRGTGGGLTDTYTATGATNDTNVFRDLIFAGGSGSQTQGSNFLHLTISGLTSGVSYSVAIYSFDSTSAQSENYTATAPTLNTSNNTLGYWASPTNATFTAPADEQTITWTSGVGVTGAAQAPVFNLVADGTGAVNLWTFGGTGVSTDFNGRNSYINGFQIGLAPTPEPTSIALLGVTGLGLMGRRRRRA